MYGRGLLRYDPAKINSKSIIELRWAYIMKRQTAFLLFFFSAYALLFYGRLLQGGQVIAYRDMLSLLLGLEQARSSLSALSWPPLWNPMMVLGKPFAADLLTSVYYPPLLVMDALSVPWRLNLSLLVHHTLAALGAAVLCRELRLGLASALLGGMLFGFGGFMVSADAFPNALHSATWLPWGFYFLIKWRRSPRADLLLGLGATYLLMLLGAMPEVWAMFLGAAALVILLSEPAASSRSREFLITLGMLPLAVLCLMGVLIVPLMEYLLYSQRAGGLSAEQVLRYSHHPISNLAFLIQRRYEDSGIAWDLFRETSHWAVSLYMGTALLMLPLGLNLLRSRAGRLATSVTALALLVASGHYLEPIRQLVEYSTLLRIFRYPEKILLIPALALSVGAAYSLQQLLNNPLRLRLLQATIAVVASALFYKLLSLPDTTAGGWAFFSADALKFLCFALALSVVATLTRRWPKILASLLVVVVGIELFNNNARLFPTIPWTTLSSGAQHMSTHDWGQSPPRIYANALGKDNYATLAEKITVAQELLPYGSGMIVGIANLNSPSSLNTVFDEKLLAFIERLPRELVAPFLGTLSVRLVTSLTELNYPGLTLSAATPTSPVVYTYSVAPFQPRARLTREAVETSSTDQFIADVLLKRIDPQRTAAIEGPVQLEPEPEFHGEARISEYRGDHVTITTNATHEAVLILADAFYPGWRAFIDGQEATIYRAQGFMRAVKVPAGKHLIHFEYAPRSFTIGMACTIVSAIVIIALYVQKRRLPLPS